MQTVIQDQNTTNFVLKNFSLGPFFHCAHNPHLTQKDFFQDGLAKCGEYKL